MKIRIKITVFFLVVSFAPILIVGLSFYNHINDFIFRAQISNEQARLSLKKTTIEDFLNSSSEDVLFLSNLSNLDQLINTDKLNLREELIKNVEKDFLEFSKEKSKYYQVRYLDQDGLEVVRVDYDKLTHSIIPKEKLQNKKGRYYFDDTMLKNKGDVFVSPLDLNIENGAIEIPYNPVIRYGTPVFDEQGSPKGIVILNIYAQNFLDGLHNSSEINNSILLVNNDGYYLHNHVDRDKEWGFMFNNNDNIYNDYPNIVKDIFSTGTGVIYDKDTHKYFISEKIIPNSFSDNNFWLLITTIDADILSGSINQELLNTIILSLIVLLIVLFLSYVLGGVITKPIAKLQGGVEIITEGNLDYKLDVKGNDELSGLANSFNKMADSIKESRLLVDKKVTEQTKQIEEGVKDLEDQQKAILNILEDVEDEKESALREKLFSQSILFSIGDGVIATDRYGKINIMNKRAEELLGWTFKEIENKKVLDVLKSVDDNNQDLPKEDRLIIKALSTGKIIHHSTRSNYFYVRKDGTKFPVGITVSPLIRDKKIVGSVIIFRDISLAYEVDKAKTEFVSLASHQLRTPLSIVRWYTEMLDDTLGKKATKVEKEYIKEIYNSNVRMIELVNALLNVSRIELGTFAVDPVLTGIKKISNDILNELQLEIKKKKQKIVKKYDSKLEKINLDVNLIGIVFQNLLTNAVKYTPEGGTITISITKQDKNVLVAIQDTGYGIPKKDQKNIFTKLFRADNIKGKDTTGTGLGLYIVRAIIEQSCDGKIWFKSAENKGTTFYFTIPLTGMKKKIGSKALE